MTHGITYLPEVDNIIVLKEGEVSEVGTYKELIAKKGAFAEFLLQHLQERQDDSEGNIYTKVKFYWLLTSIFLRSWGGQTGAWKSPRLWKCSAAAEQAKVERLWISDWISFQIHWWVWIQVKTKTFWQRVVGLAFGWRERIREESRTETDWSREIADWKRKTNINLILC